MIRGYILIQTINGIRFKYVRDITYDSSGDTKKYATYYEYGDTAGDTYGAQGDSTEIKSNYESISTSYLAATSFNEFILFPEFVGDTTILERPNYDQLVDYNGDSTWVDHDPYIRTSLSVNSIQSIQIIEERIPREQSEGNVFIPATP